MFKRGYYDYKKEGVDIKTLYEVEYTTDKKVYDSMDKAGFDFNSLSKKQFDFLEDAVSFWNSLYYREDVLHVMLWEKILLDGEIVLEQCKDMVVPTVLDAISKQRVKQAENNMELYKAENEKMKNFLVSHGIDVNKL